MEPMRGKRTSSANAIGTGRPRTSWDAVGVEENPDYTFQELLKELSPIVKELSGLLERTNEETTGTEVASLRRLADATFFTWTNLFDHYHEKRHWQSPSAFEDLLWTVADLAQELDNRIWPGIESDKAEKLIGAEKRFRDAIDASYHIEAAPLDGRGTRSLLAD